VAGAVGCAITHLVSLCCCSAWSGLAWGRSFLPPSHIMIVSFLCSIEGVSSFYPRSSPTSRSPPIAFYPLPAPPSFQAAVTPERSRLSPQNIPLLSSPPGIFDALLPPPPLPLRMWSPSTWSRPGSRPAPPPFPRAMVPLPAHILLRLPILHPLRLWSPSTWSRPGSRLAPPPTLGWPTPRAPSRGRKGRGCCCRYNRGS
jgi:hypothetical protein